MTSPFYSSLSAFLIGPGGLSVLLQSFTFSLAHQYLSQHSLSNTSLVQQISYFISLTSIFHSSVYINDTRLCKIALQHLNPCLRAHSILVTSWVTSKFKILFFLDPTLSFISPVIFSSIQCFSHSLLLSTSQVSTNAVSFTWMIFYYSSPTQIPYLLLGLIQTSLPKWRFSRSLLPISVLWVGVFSAHLSRHLLICLCIFCAIYIPVVTYLIPLNTY